MQFRPVAIAAIGVLTGSLFSSIAVFAWTGPTASPPNNNVAAPINNGSTDQVKNAGLSLNSLVVFGNGIFTGNVGVGSSNVPGKTLDVSGTIRATGEITGTMASGYGQFRMISGNYGAFLRNDGANTYFLLTAAGDQYGQWNALRPLYINDASGAVTIGTSLVVGGTIQSTSGGVVFPDGTTQTTAVRGGVSASTQVNCYAPTYGSCTANCPTGYFLSACNQYANPSGNGCASASSNVTITAYCVK